MNNLVIKPIGFLKEFLEKQLSGLTGHIEEVGYPYDTVMWGKSDDGCKWYDFEQVAYYIDGYLRVGILLDNKDIINEVSDIIYNVIFNADSDGYIGPKVLKNSTGWERWPHVVFFRAVLALFEYNKDKRILDALTNYYLKSDFKYIQQRDVFNVEIMLKLYDYTKNENLLSLAISSYEDYNLKCENDLCDKVILSKKLPYVHGVSFDEYLKLSIMLYKRTLNKKYLNVALKGHDKIDKHFMLLDGLHASNEFMLSNDIYESHETCCVSDYTWNLYYMFDALKDPIYLDKVEKCIFNAGLGSVLDDFKALQYFSSVNQVILTECSNHNKFLKGNNWMQYSPNPGTECCPGNVNRFMPNYIMNMYEEENGKIIVKLYGSSILCINNKDVLEQITNYPFDEEVTFKNLSNDTLILKLRYPSFVDSIKDFVKTYDNNNGYFEITLKKDETIKLKFKSSVVEHNCKNYSYFTKGSIVYSLNIEPTIKTTKIKNYPTYSLTPSSKWNYGLKKGSILNFSDNELLISGYEIENYKILKKYKIVRITSLYRKLKSQINGEFYFTPKVIKSNKIKYIDKQEVLKLIPYGKTRLRITAFPNITVDSKKR